MFHPLHHPRFREGSIYRPPGWPTLIPERAPRGLQVSILPDIPLHGVNGGVVTQAGLRNIVTGAQCKSYFNAPPAHREAYGRGMVMRSSAFPMVGVPQVPGTRCSMECIFVWYDNTCNTHLCHFDNGFPASGTYDRAMYVIAGVPKFYIFDGATKIAASSESIVLNRPYQIIGTSDGTNIRIYVNGQLRGTTAAGNAFSGFGAGVHFITGDSNAPEGFTRGDTGSMLMAQYANVAWGPEEVQARWANPFGHIRFGHSWLINSLIVGLPAASADEEQASVSMM